MNSRNKGASYEREIANRFAEYLGVEVKRNLDQSRDGGSDISLPPYLIECKRRARIIVYEWIEQAAKAADNKNMVPIVVCRADREDDLVILRLNDFLPLMGFMEADSDPASVAASSSSDERG